MKLTNEEIVMILQDFQKEPDSKAAKMRLLAAFFQKVAPMVGLEMEGDIVKDLMEWAVDAHLEECSTCRDFEEKGLAGLFSGSPDA